MMDFNRKIQKQLTDYAGPTPIPLLGLYGLGIFVGLVSVYNLILAVGFRFENAALAFPGDKTDPLYELGTSLGFWGTLFFCINFVLAARWRWVENLFQGLDKVYHAHAFVGKASLTMILLHLAVLVLQAVPKNELVSQYLLPGVDVSFTLGLASLLLLTGLMVVTLWVKLKYQTWLKTHQFMGIAYVLGGLHAIVLQGDWYMILLTGVGAYAWVYSLGLYRKYGPQSGGEIQQITPKGSVTEIIFHLEKPLKARPGQFIFFSVRRSAAPIPDEAHPFSISAILDERTWRISVKTLGDYTGLLGQLRPGDRITVFGPYGKFGQTPAKKTQVWVAGGIGITPFLSMLRAEAVQPRGNSVHLIWGVKDASEAVYEQEILEQVQRAPHVHYHLQVGPVSTGTIAQLVGEQAAKEADLLVCGPPRMMQALKKEWKAQGKPAGQIFSEEFAMRS